MPQPVERFPQPLARWASLASYHRRDSRPTPAPGGGLRPDKAIGSCGIWWAKGDGQRWAKTRGQTHMDESDTTDVNVYHSAVSHDRAHNHSVPQGAAPELRLVAVPLMTL